jgi:hypothetical protein
MMPVKRRWNHPLEGPKAIAAATALSEERAKRSAWPYPWTYPPPGAIRVSAGLDSSGTIAVPVAGTPTQGILYTVEEGFQFCLTHIVVEFLTSGIIGPWNPGDALWSLTVNRPVGLTTFQGYVAQGFSGVDVPLGTLQIPWPLEMADFFDANEALRIVLTNVNLSSGDPNFFKCILLGWRWPKEELRAPSVL